MKGSYDILIVLVFVALIALCLISVTVYIRNLEELANKTVTGQAETISASIKKVEASIGELDRKVAIEIKYMDRDNSEMAMYQEFKNLVMKAQRSIFVVNSYLVEHSAKFDTNKETEKARDEYYDALLRKAQGGIKYKRIVQFKRDGSTFREMALNKDHDNHFRLMLKLMGQKPQDIDIELKKAEARRLSTFLLIDDQHLIWQINEVLMDDDNNEDLRLHGAFIINDPQKKITNHFQKYYDSLYKESVPMSLKDLDTTKQSLPKQI
jgi:hypothetical protein